MAAVRGLLDGTMPRACVRILVATVLFSLACRPKQKPNVLAYIPADAPAVAWMPAPQASIQAITLFLRPFEGTTLGSQLTALRQDLRRQLGIDPLAAADFEAFGLD